tara:strand:+ start:5918 stop:7009 length:1092 start_codon:yes stop_codon:yes gene_type:complete
MSTTSEVIYKAPGRICLFGDHQDYLGLPIIACAINRFVELHAKPNDTKMFHLNMPDIKISRSFSIYESFDILEHADHIASTIRVVKKYGCFPDRGYSIILTGKIPMNSGLSSSSAVVVAWVRFLLNTFGCSQEITHNLIAKIAYESEVLEHNSPGGKMDQYTIAIGDMIFLQTNENTNFSKLENIPEGLIVGESGIPKNTQGVLGDLKSKALSSIEIVKKYDPTFELATATLLDIEKYDDLLTQELKPFFYASIKNHQITLEAAIILNEKTLNYQKIGRLINEHHLVLKDVLKITTPKIDAMINAAIQAGAYGAKIVGSGGGGSICVMASLENQQQVMIDIMKAGAKNVYPVSIVSSNNNCFI